MTEQRIGAATQVTLHFAIKLDNGDVVDSTFDKQPATFKVGDGNLLPGFEVALYGFKAGDKRILLILVTTAGDVQNRILFTERPYSPSELVVATNYLNQYFSGHDFAHIRDRVKADLLQLRGDLQDLMAAALAAGDEAMNRADEQYVISGERNLLEVEELSSNMKRLRELFDLFEQRTALVELLDVSLNG